MAPNDTLEYLPDTLVPLRNAPVQARSTARLTALLDAAAAVVDEIGFERLTTAMVADRAGASIGTVYRYFPDRIALLQALASRNLERVLNRVADEVVDARHSDWAAAMTGAFEVLADAFRTEPGFRGIRVGDVIDLRPAPNERTYNSVVANRMLDAMVSRFGVPDSAEIRLTFEAAVEVTDALMARAFARDADGDDAFLVAARGATYGMLSGHFGDVQR
ncbi:MAG: TetR/AcrR family transcriptional regulator [Rhodoglobus sp.]|nr:TetR/AcrR family transcriptional regulator [Rhodoglobus sp.]